jgi:hypothetical protein
MDKMKMEAELDRRRRGLAVHMEDLPEGGRGTKPGGSPGPAITMEAVHQLRAEAEKNPRPLAERLFGERGKVNSGGER